MAETPITFRPLTDQLSALAQTAIDAELNENGIFDYGPLAPILLARATGTGRFGTESGVRAMGGKLVGIDPIRREAMTDPDWQPRFIIGTFGGIKNMPTRGTLPTADNTNRYTAGAVRFTKTVGSLKQWHVEKEANRSPAGVGSLMADDIELAVQENVTKVMQNLVIGCPSDQAESRWDAPQSLRHICDDGTGLWYDQDANQVLAADAKMFAGRDREAFTAVSARGTTIYPLKGNLSSTATNFAFSLLDDAEAAIGHGLGGELDLWICNRVLFKKTIKPLAQAQGAIATYVTKGMDLPEFGLVGFKHEYVRYGSTIIISDPFIPTGEDASSTSVLMGFNTKDIILHFDPAQFFSVGTIYAPMPGQDEADVANLFTRYRMFYRNPSNSYIYTNVN